MNLKKEEIIAKAKELGIQTKIKTKYISVKLPSSNIANYKKLSKETLQQLTELIDYSKQNNLDVIISISHSYILLYVDPIEKEVSLEKLEEEIKKKELTNKLERHQLYLKLKEEFDPPNKTQNIIPMTPDNKPNIIDNKSHIFCDVGINCPICYKYNSTICNRNLHW